MTESESDDPPRVVVVGGGVAGLTAATFTARAGLDTAIVDGDESILRRNAFLENVPGFPAGVNSRRFLALTREQARRAGALFEDGIVTGIRANPDDETLTVTVDGEHDLTADYVICTSWSNTDYLDGLDLEFTERGSKTFVETDERGFTGVTGLYAAGRIAGTHHQTVVAAGDGASVALSVIEASEVPFYHDWVAPEGYFTDRGREVPPGCEEIDEAERQRREAAAREVMLEHFEEPHPDEPSMHPSLVDDG
jgi:thioredoxin reductase